MKALITANGHPLYGQVVEITHRARLEGVEVWVVESTDGTTDYVREGEYKIVKRQGEE